jgi:hypothetical protein
LRRADRREQLASFKSERFQDLQLRNQYLNPPLFQYATAKIKGLMEHGFLGLIAFN